MRCSLSVYAHFSTALFSCAQAYYRPNVMMIRNPAAAVPFDRRACANLAMERVR